MLDLALKYLAAGLSLLPATLPSKAPCHAHLPRVDGRPSWLPYASEQPTEEEVRRWYSRPDRAEAIGVICGRVSGNLEVLDFDDGSLITPWSETIKAIKPELLKVLVVERSLRGGFHIYYRCDTIEKNQKLAWGMRDGAKKATIETRGEGGYVVAYPSPGYQIMRNDLTAIKTISVDDRDILLSAARGLDEMPEVSLTPESAIGATNRTGTSPGDAYNADPTAMLALLEAHGWVTVYGRGNMKALRRPGKREGISATWNHTPNRLHVFSTSCEPLQAGRAYQPFQVFALLAHNGDFHSAARDLVDRGYGESFRQKSFGNSQNNQTIESDQSPEQDSPADEGIPTCQCPRSEWKEWVTQGERGMGALFVHLYRGQLCYDSAAKCWHCWGPTGWQLAAKGQEQDNLSQIRKCLDLACEKRAIRLCEGIVELGKEALEIVSKQVRRLNTVAYSSNVLTFARSGEEGLGITGEEWDRHTEWVLPVANGVVDLRNPAAGVRPDVPTEYIRRRAPIAYRDDAECPRWEQFIEEIMPDADTAKFLKRLLGYCITGSVQEHVFPVFWGPMGRNGKDTLLERLKAVLGPLAAPISTKALLDNPFSPEHDSALVELQGRRLVWASEAKDRAQLDAAKIKLWTGGGTLKGRAPYAARPIEFSQSHKLLLITNPKPQLPANDQALWRRVLLIPFERVFCDSPKASHERQIDRGLGAQLDKEKEGILRWLVDGCLEWQVNGLNPPESVLAATTEYRTEEDTLQQYLNERTIADSAAQVTSSGLYNDYKEWCETQKVRYWSVQRFAREMRGKGFMTAHNNKGNYYPGLTLRPDNGGI